MEYTTDDILFSEDNFFVISDSNYYYVMETKHTYSIRRMVITKKRTIEQVKNLMNNLL